MRMPQFVFLLAFFHTMQPHCAIQRSAGLLEVNSAGNAIMRVETTPNVSGNRRSIRIHSKTGFTGGLVIMDAVHMPTGCGVWPWVLPLDHLDQE